MTATKLYDVEHALDMYADSCVQMPAAFIYDSEQIKPFADQLKRCHIYMIGVLPKVELVGYKQLDRTLVVSLTASGKPHDVEIGLEPSQNLKQEEGVSFIEDSAGQRFEPNSNALMMFLHRKIGLHFHIHYIGQAFGKDGERSALDRLLKHEKLQEIAVKRIGDDNQLNLLMIEVVPANRVITVFDPRAEKADTDGKRITAGLDKLFGTTERERVSLYEAAMIRYFQPKLNKEFSDSFPSTNMKVLEDCYSKDFSAVAASFSIDVLPYYLCSDTVAAKHGHLAFYDLHADDARKAFFFNQ